MESLPPVHRRPTDIALRSQYLYLRSQVAIAFVDAVTTFGLVAADYLPEAARLDAFWQPVLPLIFQHAATLAIVLSEE